MDRHDLEFSFNLFKALMYNHSIKQNCNEYFRDEITFFTKEKLYNLLCDYMVKNNTEQLKGHITNFVMDHSHDDRLYFYDVLRHFSDMIITRNDNRYCFRYTYTDIWRNLTREIDEELFVISFIIHDDLRRNIDRKHEFSWPFCIEHDNHDITMLLRRDLGVSENHFHLRGSSPYYYISWVYLMNNPCNQSFEDETNKIDRSKLKTFFNNENEYPLKLIWRKAAAIRIYLYCLMAKAFFPGLTTLCENRLDRLRTVLFKKIIPYNDTEIYLFPLTEIQDCLVDLNDSDTIDYAQKMINRDSLYYNLAGERFILYNCLKFIYQQESGYEEVSKLLYLYIQMKHRFRVELVQSNDRAGFNNFAEYQNRKDSFILWNLKSEESIAVDTICSIIDNTKLYRAELRISPQATWQENNQYISIYDRAIETAIKRCNNKYSVTKDNFFYTLHFTKKRFENPFELYRHYQYRQDIEKKAEAIINLRLYHSDNIASRILGIDACASEIDCRPEVFAPVYRYLLNYEPDEKQMNGKPFKQLKATYHVAEDNYDIADALRAIYEAIFFLELPSGSRLGHATLLGIPPREYYNNNNNPIAMPRQIFLDNVVWMYYFINEYGITFDKLPHLLSYLHRMFEVHFHKIFDDDLQPDYVQETLYKAMKSSCLEFPSERKGYNVTLCNFDMYHYYLSYLLRGDDPELYRKGYINGKCAYSEEYKICQSINKMNSARENFEASYLYYLYHYCERIKLRGMETIQEDLPDYFIEALSLIQNQMKRIISDFGIGIETNPTSNNLISIIKNYSEHPISSFYYFGLAPDTDNVQLNVSVNTDDKSVFSTCLSNEYAYLFYYLENKQNNDGKTMYSRYELLQWLDAVRKMGNEQSFDN